MLRDPALLRSGRIDRKVELPLPTEEARARIMQIHSRKMNVNDQVCVHVCTCADWPTPQLCACLHVCMFACLHGPPPSLYSEAWNLDG